MIMPSSTKAMVYYLNPEWTFFRMVRNVLTTYISKLSKTLPFEGHAMLEKKIKYIT